MTIGKGISPAGGSAGASAPSAGGTAGASAPSAGGRAGASAPGASGGDHKPTAAEREPAADPRGPASPIDFRLDPASGVPTYLQLVQQVEHALRLGYLKPGDQLPKVRDVVAVLAINPNTVLKAYRELETKGLTAGRPGQGTFIRATLNQVALPELTGLHRSLLGWLSAAHAVGLDEDGIVALFTSALRDFRDHCGGSGDHRSGAGDRRSGAGDRRGGTGRRKAWHERHRGQRRG